MATRIGWGWFVFSVMTLVLGARAEGQGLTDAVSLHLTSTQSIDNSDLRGFNPSVIVSRTDPFPDTSRPCCLEGSTMFGNGLPLGNAGNEIRQNCDPQGFVGAHPPSFPSFNNPGCNAQTTGAVFQNDLLFQSSRNGLLSRRSTVTPGCNDLGTTADDRRCNEITFGFLQDVQELGQVMDLSFSLRSLTDADGNLLGAAQGTFTQSITESGATKSCTGTFTFDEQNGFVMTSGPLHEC